MIKLKIENRGMRNKALGPILFVGRFASRQAFTLIEVIVGITVLTIVIVAIGVLAITSIRANQGNIYRMTAYYLAQEGVEGFRNMRDSNWLQNYAWNKGANFGGMAGWGSDFDKDGYYGIDYLEDAGATNPAPWVLRYLGEFAVADASVPNNVLTQAAISGTPYGRYVELRYNPSHSNDWVQVTAVVFWQDHGRYQEVKVSTELTDWREGPL